MVMDEIEREHILQYREDDDIVRNIEGGNLRGKFKISKDGSCPRCKCRDNKFVILDFLFSMDEMPHILEVLMKQGKAVLWSSQDTSKCKEAPTFLCGGRCPSNPKLGGFNLNWKLADLESIYFPEFATKKDDDSTLDKKINSSLVKVKAKEEKPASKLVGLLPKANKNGSVREMYQVVLEGDESLQKVEPALESKKNDSNENDDDNNNDSDSENHIDNDDDDDNDENNDEEIVADTFDPSEINFNHYQKLAKWTVLDEEVFDKQLYDETETDTGILTMLALEGAKVDWAEGTLKLWDGNESTPAATESDNATSDSVDKAIKNEVSSTATPANKQLLKPIKAFTGGSKKVKFPVSKDGTCPYCKSNDVIYIILMYKDNKPEDLPPILRKLLQRGVAIQMKKGDSEPPSFQCQTCSYGFNLDWSSASLESVFSVSAKDDVTTPSPSTKAETTALPNALPQALSLPMPFPPPFPPPYPAPIPVPPPNFANPIPIPPPFAMQPWPNPSIPPPMPPPPFWQEPCFPPFNLPLPERKPFMPGEWLPPMKKTKLNNIDATRYKIQTTEKKVESKPVKPIATDDGIAAPGTEETAEINFVIS